MIEITKNIPIKIDEFINAYTEHFLYKNGFNILKVSGTIGHYYLLNTKHGVIAVSSLNTFVTYLGNGMWTVRKADNQR